MTGTGFYEQQKFRPTGLALVVALHAAALGALVMVKSPVFEKAKAVNTIIFDVPLPRFRPSRPAAQNGDASAAGADNRRTM